MDREDIRLEVRRLIQDVDTVNPKWSDAILNARIDQSHDRIACLTKCIESRITADLVADTAEYNLPTYVLEVISAQALNSSSIYQPLKKVTEDELDWLDENWRQTTGTLPTHFWQRRYKIGLYPSPSAALASGLRININRRPTAFTADVDIPFEDIPELYPFHDTICFDVAAICKMDEGDQKAFALLTAKSEQKIREINYQMANKQEDTRMPNIYETARVAPRRTA